MRWDVKWFSLVSRFGGGTPDTGYCAYVSGLGSGPVEGSDREKEYRDCKPTLIGGGWSYPGREC